MCSDSVLVQAQVDGLEGQMISISNQIARKNIPYQAQNDVESEGNQHKIQAKLKARNSPSIHTKGVPGGGNHERPSKLSSRMLEPKWYE